MLFSSSVVFVLFFLLISQSNGARILVTGAVDSGTHIGSMVPMVKRLASSGHQIVVLEIATLKKARNLGTNVTVLFIPVPEDGGIAASLSASMFRVVSNGRILHLPYLFGDQKVHEYILSHAPMLRSLLNTAFDLVILDELFGVHSFAIALHLNRHYGVPYIIYSTTMMIQSSAYSLALGRNFVSEPNLLTSPPASSGDKYDPTNILDRLDNLNTVAWDLFRVKLHVESHLRSALSSLRLFCVPNFAFSDFFSKASFVFADYLDRVPAPLAESPSILPVSSNCGRARPLPSDLANFVSHFSSKGTIYVAFGTNLQWRYAPKGILNAFFGALNRLCRHSHKTRHLGSSIRCFVSPGHKIVHFPLRTQKL
uniref:glucuronosyltransferase n=1 Tax=Globodera rostochiensis TaxID=31243 RepID=A0A914HDZ0_GLORO